jgi:hypothetical protein
MVKAWRTRYSGHSTIFKEGAVFGFEEALRTITGDASISKMTLAIRTAGSEYQLNVMIDGLLRTSEEGVSL